MTDKLTDNDKQRIEQEWQSIRFSVDADLDEKAIMLAEYAIIYERQQQAITEQNYVSAVKGRMDFRDAFRKQRQQIQELTKENEEAMQTITKQGVRHGNDFAELSKLHKEFTEQAIKIDEKNIKIHQLEAERSELIRRIKSILKASTVHDKISILEELEQLLNSLKTK